MAMKFTLRGAPQMERTLRQIGEHVQRQAADAVREEAEEVKRDAQARTPVETGELRDSAHVVADGATARIVYDAAHAPNVHENLDAEHTTGEAKFLEHALNDAAPTMAPRLGRRIHLKKAVRP